jgi:molybdopterin converting factor small subunit
MNVKVLFHSYFRELTGCTELTQTIEDGTPLGRLLDQLRQKFPKLKPMERSTLTAVGVEYQSPEYRLRDGDEVSLFPPVQGG